MKKKIRKINVFGTDYVWLVSQYNCDGDGGFLLRIYKDRKIFVEKLCHDDSVTPRMVRGEIEEALIP